MSPNRYSTNVTLGSDPAVSGAPYMTASIEGAHSTYRTGGLANFINNKLLAKPLGEGLTLGTNMYVRQGMNDIGTMNHEGYHGVTGGQTVPLIPCQEPLPSGLLFVRRISGDCSPLTCDRCPSTTPMPHPR